VASFGNATVPVHNTSQGVRSNDAPFGLLSAGAVVATAAVFFSFRRGRQHDGGDGCGGDDEVTPLQLQQLQSAREQSGFLLPQAGSESSGCES
jgi:hypothetical protein